MSSLSRRRALGLGGAALFGGGSGCLGARAARRGPVDLVSINHTDAGRYVDVRVREATGGDLLRRAFRLDGGDLRTAPGALAASRFTVTASLVANPLYEAERRFDFRGCDAGHVVVAVLPGPEIVVERQRGDC